MYQNPSSNIMIDVIIIWWSKSALTRLNWCPLQVSDRVSSFRDQKLDMLSILIDLPVTELCIALRPGLWVVMWSCISCHSHTHSEATVAVYPHAETVEKWKLHLTNSSPANNQPDDNCVRSGTLENIITCLMSQKRCEAWHINSILTLHTKSP